MLKFGLFCLIGLEVGLALAYLIAIWVTHDSPTWLDLNGWLSLPSLLQAIHLFAIGMISSIVLLLRQRMQRPISWILPLVLAVLCFYGGIDEVTKAHLYLKQYNWQFIYLSILGAIPILCWRDLLWLWQTQRSSVLWVLIGLSIFLLGGFGTEAIKHRLYSEFSPDSVITFAGERHSLPLLAEHLRITVEEFAELLGETLILFGVAQFAHQSLTAPHDPAISVH